MAETEFKKGYFDSGREYNKQKGLYAVREALPIKGLISRKSKQHHNLLLMQKWKYLRGCRKVLDAGCGRGEFMALNPYHAEVYGIDVIKEELEMAKKKGFNVKYADLNKKLPFENSSFDGINCSHVLEHLENPEMMISEFKRVLKNNGILVLSVPNFSFKRFYADPTHKRPYPKEALFRLLKDNGFESVRIKNGVYLNQIISALFVLTPKLRFGVEKAFGIISPWEITGVSRNKK